MDYLKQFLHDLTESGVYFAEVVDNIAEIYVMGDQTPAIFLELKGNAYHINIRCDLPPRIVARIMYDMTVLDEDIVIGPDFFVSQEDGVLYGPDATALFFATIFRTMEEVQQQQEAELMGATYIVEQPIYGYGNKNENKQNKLQRLWGTDLE